MPYGHDGATYAGWQTAFEMELADGVLYPRWLSAMSNGAGSPAFFFYPPLVFYVVAGSRAVVDFGPDVFRQIALGVFPFFAVSSLCFYWAVRPWLGRAGAVTGALLYLAMPYHYGVDLWFRADFVEFAGYAWAPLCFGFLWRIGQNRWAMLGLALSFALLVATHLPSAVVVGFGLGVVALWRTHQLGEPLYAIRFAAGIAVGLALTGIYLLPALTMQDLTSMHRMWLGGLNFRYNFLFMSGDPNMPPIQSGLVGATLAVLVPVFALSSPDTRSRLFWPIAAVGAVWIMMSPPSLWIWQVLPPLQKLQFPWRFGMLLDLSLAVLAGAAVAELVRNRKAPALRWCLAGAIFIVAANGVLIHRGHYFQAPFADPSTVRAINEALAGLRDSGEYRSPWTEEPARAGPQVTVLSGDAAVTVEKWRSREISVRFEARQPAELLIRQYYLPLWEAVLDDGSVLSVAPATDQGLLKVTVPSGSHTVSLRLVPAPAEKWGGIVSLAGLLGAGLLFAGPMLARSRRRPASPQSQDARIPADYAESGGF
jgi:hypothetical protein